MRFFDLFLKRRRQPRKRKQRDNLIAGWDPDWDDKVEDARREQLRRDGLLIPAPTREEYAPAIMAKAAEIVAQAEADSRAAHTSAETQAWGEWDQPGTGLAEVPARELAPPPPMPFSGVSRIMVDRIAYPDPADLSIDKDRHYRETFRLTGVATGTSASLEDTGMWALPALEPGDGTGVRL